jgi:hypothetical protein
MSKKDDDILAEALKRFDICEDVNSEINEEALDDLRFIIGDQWPESIRKERADDARPCLTINKLPNYVNQVVNDQRQNRPAIKVRPVDDEADVKTANVINGIVRHIQYNSDAEIAYDTACDYAVSCSRGYLRILTDYTNSTSFDQEILIKRIDNPFSVHFPIHLCKEADYSDAPYAFITDWISKDSFKKQFPDEDMSDFETNYTGETKWMKEDSLRIAEYFYVEESTKKLYLFSDGTTSFELPPSLPEGIELVKERETVVKKVNWYLLSGKKILQKKEWPGKWIPVIPVLGKEINVEGKKNYISLVRFAKDPQRMYNYWKSSETEMVALAPKVPFVGAEGQFEGHEGKWQTANRKNHAYLEYKPTTVAGQPAPPPQRQRQTEIPSAIVNAARESNEDIKATTGIFDASLGARGNETSGRAIMARQNQGNTANFHFTDNLNRAIRHAGRIIVDLIPLIYDTERSVRILGDNKKEEVVFVNKEYTDGKGASVLYDLSAGQYDVVMDTGPSYMSKRIEATEAMIQLAQTFPNAVPLIMDKVAENLDFPGASDIAIRFKKMLPEQLKEDDGQGGPTIEDIKKAQQTVQQQQEMIQEMDKVIQKMSSDLESKDKDRETKIDIALLNSETAVILEQMKQSVIQLSEAKAIYLDEMNRLRGETGESPTDQESPESTQNVEPQNPME